MLKVCSDERPVSYTDPFLRPNVTRQGFNSEYELSEEEI